MLRRRFTLQGQVQGVGFRPFVYTLALESSLSGFVRNSSEGVVVEVQGLAKALENFAHGLETRLPPLARVTGKKVEELAPLGEENSFTILSSEDAGSGHAVLVSPDIALCADCAADMSNPANRRYLYPFTNCTNCGPRYTITRSIPYDRAFTSMACFPMCPDCRAEYENPANRRFHAQPNACPICGPKVWFVSKEDLGKGADASAPPSPQLFALFQTAALLRGGGVAAIKGLGGFHLACDALNEEAVSRLRRLKERPHKPFALMVRDQETAGRLAHMGEKEAALLHSPEHPIVLCRCREDSPIAPSCSPDTAMVGLMLPYTPLHEALFAVLAEEGITTLVMTSGNPGGEPICLGNREAVAGLAHMADGFLLHDRDILIRVDDSVVCPLEKQILFYRRARGYVPSPVSLGDLFSNKPKGAGKTGQGRIEDIPEATADTVGSVPEKNGAAERSNALRVLSDKLSNTMASPGSITDPVVLGVGAELKNTFCLTKKTDAFVSQHIGDMGNLETADFHCRMIGHLSGLLQVRPNVVVRDLHPDFLSSVYARETGLPVLALQHHYAHAHAVLAEHQYLAEEGFPPALVLALDGTGLGEDGTLWGGELLLVDALGKGGKAEASRAEGQKQAMHAGKAATPVSGPVHARLGHIAPMLLPGGDAAVREPWRIAHALMESLGLLASTTRPLPWMPEYEAPARFIPSMIARRLNSPESTSCGRLFDAVAALLGLCNATSYEGQAAIRLEEAQYTGRLSAIQIAGDESTVPQEFFCVSSEGPPAASAGLPFESDAAYLCPVLAPDSGRGSWQLDTHSLFRALWQDWQEETPVPVLARRFHASLAQGLADLASAVAQERGLRHVGLSGGCMQNKTLVLTLSQRLRQKGLEPLLHRQLPPNDACISLGQAAWGLLTVSRGGF